MTLREPEKRGDVGWIFIGDTQTEMEESGAYAASAITEQLEEFRWDPEVRVIVLTGQHDGQFYRIARRSHWDDERFKGRLNPMNSPVVPTGASKPGAQEILLRMEKPVIARVNGDAIGNGASLLWLCDVIIAQRDARIACGFEGLGDIIDGNGERRGMPWALTPTYGTYSFLMMPPPLMKEYIMLSRVFTAEELAEMHVVNYAVEPEALDPTVDRIVEEFLARPQHVLVRSKRLVHKHLVNQFNNVEDLAAAYGALDLWEQAAAGEMD